MLAILLHAPPAIATNPLLDITHYAHTAWTLRGAAFKGSPRAIAQTTDGYLWLATEFGVSRFDGVRFVPRQPPAGPPLASQDVVALRGTADGSLWIGTTQGLARWHDRVLTPYPEMAGQYVAAIHEDAQGTVWVGTSAELTDTAKLCAILVKPNIAPNAAPNTAATIATSVSSKAAAQIQCEDAGGALGRFVISLHADRQGQLWAGAATGLWRWSPGRPTAHPMPSPRAEIHAVVEREDGALLLALNREIRAFKDGRLEHVTLPGEEAGLKPTSLLYDREGALWIGTQDRGLLHLAQGRISRFTKSDGLSGDFVSEIFEDREGNVWVATLEGLNRFHALAIPTMSAKHGLSTSSVLSVLADPDGTVWLGTVNGLNRWKDGQIVAYGSQPGAPQEGVASLLRDSRGRLWVSSPRGLSYLEGDRLVPVSGVPGGYVHAMAEDRGKSVWIADQDRGLFELRDGRLARHVTRAQLGGRSIRTLAADPSRNALWLGFFHGGIARFEDGRIVGTYDTAAGVGAGEVTSLYPDASGALWIATQGGLSRFFDGRVTTLGEKDGLPCAGVHWVMADDARTLWAYTACGLVRITREELDAWIQDRTRRIAPTVYIDRDGVSSRAHAGSYGPKVTHTADGRLLFATYDGVSVIDPRRIPFNKAVPPVHIERIIADGTTYDPAADLQLQPYVRNLRIDFTAVSLIVPEKVRFRYKLEGRDEEWVEVANRREVFYTDLPPKQYRFRVVACNNDGVWNTDGAMLTFAILPSFYQTRGFLLGAAVLMATALWTLYRVRLRRIAVQMNLRFEERLTERARIAQELHDTLLQGFISTAMQLDTISETVADETIKTKLDRVLGRMRDVINEGRDAVRGLRAQPALDDLEQTLTHAAEELRGVQPVEIRVIVVGLRQPLHPLVRDEITRIGREALANAFRHAHATRVEIELEFAAAHFRLKVRDNGQGFEAEIAESGRPGHWGIPGMRERAERLGARLQLWSRVKAGTEVALTVPAQLAFPKA